MNDDEYDPFRRDYLRHLSDILTHNIICHCIVSHHLNLFYLGKRIGCGKPGPGTCAGQQGASRTKEVV